MSVFILAAQVREYLELNATASSSKYTDATIGSNIRAATYALEKATHRRLGPTTETLKFTTNGAAYLTIPGLRTASAVTLSSAALVADTSYWLIPDAQQTGVYTGIQFRAFGTGRQGGSSYLSFPDWFDTNRDSPWHPGNRGGPTSQPNDLSIAGTWGYVDDSTMPEAVRHATKVLAAYYTKRPDAILSGALAMPDGGMVDLSNLPIEVQQFIREWDVGSQVTGL